MMRVDRQEAYSHLRSRYPFLVDLIAATGEVRLPEPNEDAVACSLVRIVAGQMLSRTAAQTILARMGAAADRLGLTTLYVLPEAELRACGLSGRKARTVSMIAEIMSTEPARLERWRELPFPELRREVAGIWGLSDWSASMLAIFDFAHPDVFPLSDGSIGRAIRLLEDHHMKEGDKFQHEAASPYGSYLAITLWAALDIGVLTKQSRPPWLIRNGVAG